MSYRENEVVAKFTQGSVESNCKEYNAYDLIDMFDETYVTDDLGDNNFTVNDCVQDGIIIYDLVVTEESDDNMYVHLNKDTADVVECSLELDLEFARESE